jgi:hypothetical protein
VHNLVRSYARERQLFQELRYRQRPKSLMRQRFLTGLNQTENHGVGGGSIPPLGTMKINDLMEISQ